jgi:cytoskeletal protein RodZ
LSVTPKCRPLGQHADLATLRKSAGLSLDQIAESTKISVRFLSAIEQDRLDELPGGLFARSYIRQYAAAVGCDPAPLLKSIEEPEPVPESPARQPAQRAEPGALLRFFSLR